jgi:hypothetical protein
MALFKRKSDQADLIDLRETKSTAPKWGSPVACPECDGPGYLEHIDPFRELMFMHCTECFHKYEVSKSDLGTPTSQG